MTHAGRLLVATPLIADPSFERTVVLLLAHGPDGAFGVVINRPSDTLVSEVADAWEEVSVPPSVVFVGGPVGRDAILGIGRSPDLDDGHAESIVGDCGTVDLHRTPADGPFAWHSVRLFAGSAGWAPGQLEDELEEGAWWVVDATADDVVARHPHRLWADVLRRQRGEVAWYANCPDDPTAN